MEYGLNIVGILLEYSRSVFLLKLVSELCLRARVLPWRLVGITTITLPHSKQQYPYNTHNTTHTEG